LSLRYLDELRNVDGVEVRVHETTLYNSILRSDETLLVNTHVYGTPAAQSPVATPAPRARRHGVRSVRRQLRAHLEREPALGA